MERRRIFITGANGFVGRHLIAHLTDVYADGASVFAAVRPDEVESPGIAAAVAGWTGRPGPNLAIVPLDVTDAAQAAEAVHRARPDWIVHLAARASGADVDRDAISAVNVEGTRNLLEAASQLSPFPRTLVVSTGYVYGSTDPARPAREEDPLGQLRQLGAYTDSKIQMEAVARNYSKFTIVVRPFSHTGPGQTVNFAIPAFARQLARTEMGLGSPVLRVGNLSASRDLLDVRDVVRAYTLLLSHGDPGEVYNVASGAPVAIGDALTRLRALCRVRTEVMVDPERLRPADIALSSGDPLKLWTRTKWTREIPLDTTLADTLDYWRTHSD